MVDPFKKREMQSHSPFEAVESGIVGRRLNGFLGLSLDDRTILILK